MITPLIKQINLGIVLLFGIANILAQQPIKLFEQDTTNTIQLIEYSKNKIIPKSIRAQTLIALSYYPELKDVKIIFRFKNRKTPLTSRPRFFDVFKRKKNRTYIITISNKTNSPFSQINLQKLPYNAQIGVLGHEIAHISFYKNKSTFQLLGLVFKIMNGKFVDNFEYETDKRTIMHGLGYQLLDWSIFVRNTLNIKEWQGATNISLNESANERYMSPNTIQKLINELEIYKQ